MQLANRLDIQLRSVVEWQELFHPDAVLLRQRYIYFLIMLFVKCLFVPMTGVEVLLKYCCWIIAKLFRRLDFVTIVCSFEFC